MIGIGTDLVELDRFRVALTRTPRLADRLFSDAERTYAARLHDPVPRLAARFAAKEAVMKALQVGLGAFAMREVEVVRVESGAPALRLTGGAMALAESRGVTSWLLTMTHSETMAHAIAVAL